MSVLYLNPPYSQDSVYGRLENRFLEHFTPTLMPGEGVLLFVVPFYALAASATYLAQHFEDIHCYRFPAPYYEDFKQVVLVARRSAVDPLAPVFLASQVKDARQEALTNQILDWASRPENIPVLGHVEDQYALALSGQDKAGLVFEKMALDLPTLLKLAPVWQSALVDTSFTKAGGSKGKSKTGNISSSYAPARELGLDKTIADLVGQPYPVAVPPQPAHLAMALSSGIFNGQRIEPNNPNSGLPPLLVKGVFSRDFKTISQNHDKEGKVTSTVQIQQPSLKVFVLDLEKYTYHELSGLGEAIQGELEDLDLVTTSEAGLMQNGDNPVQVANMTLLDLLKHYGNSLTRIMAVQFPAMHQPGNPAHQLVLPVFPRQPFRVQSQAVMALLKLLGNGDNPLLVGQPGTGKTTMSLMVAASLSGAAYASTIEQLRNMGHLHTTIKPVKRLLVVCPPINVATWAVEIPKVLPGARVQIVETISDLNPELSNSADDSNNIEVEAGAGLTIYLLSREKAKLGHGWKPGVYEVNTGHYTVELRCPDCGTTIREEAEKLVRGRLRCTNSQMVNVDEVARLSNKLASILAKTFPTSLEVTVFTQHQRYMARQGRKPQKNTIAAQVGSVAVLKELVGLICNSTPEDKRVGELLKAATKLALGTAFTEGCPLIELARQLYLASLHVETNNGKLMRRTALEFCLITSFSGPGINPNQLAVQARLRNQFYKKHKRLWDDFDLTRQQLLLKVEGNSKSESKKGKTNKGWINNYELAVGEDEGAGVGFKLVGYKVEMGSDKALLEALKQLLAVAQFKAGPPCGAFLYQAAAQPRRYSVAKYISRHCQGFFDMLIIDELQEFANEATAQTKAAHRLVSLRGVPTIGLSGSLTNGYASSLYATFWSFSRRFRREFERDQKQDFITRYGYRKQLVVGDSGNSSNNRQVLAYGSVSDRETEVREDDVVRQLGEAPGVLPLFVLQHLLPIAVTVQKRELELEMPPVVETPVLIEFDEENEQDQKLLRAYERLRYDVVECVKQDRFDPELAGALWGAVTELPSYLDLCHADTGNREFGSGERGYVVAYPQICGGRVIAAGESFPADYLAPKERWLIETLRSELAEGRNAMIFLRHTGKNSSLVKRLTRLIEQHVGEAVAVLDSSKVNTTRRQDWLEREVIAKNRRILLLNPKSVKTGLNNLVRFNTAIWFELDYEPITYIQGNGRLDRPNQLLQVRIYFPVYRGTAQQIALEHLANKVKSSLQVDGLNVVSALEAVGAGTNMSNLNAVMSLGRQIYEQLVA